MSDSKGIQADAREPLLDPVDRVSEMLFGLFMALTFVGAVSVATADRQEIHTMLVAALGCNLAWGMVDGVMYLVQTVVSRGRALKLALAVRAADARAGREIIDGFLAHAVEGLVSAAEIEAIRARLVALPALPAQPKLHRDDLLAALGIFLICVATTFPVVLPFVFIGDVATAKIVSRGIALAMLFGGGFALGRYAGYGAWKAGLLLMALGTALVAAIMALGG